MPLSLHVPTAAVCRLVHRPARALHRQYGQALVLGIFFLLAGLAGTYFLFNTGQMVTEKNRLVTTADAVAHGAGVMQARALNFDAYGNRALVANEVLIAQLVSLSSWSQYVQTHAENLPWQFPECAEKYGIGALYGTAFKYDAYFAAMCYLSVQYSGEFVAEAAQQLPRLMQEIVIAVEANKKLIQLAQKALHGPGGGNGSGGSALSAFQLARAAVMQEIADANYRDAGTVTATAQLLTDGWPGFTRRYEGNERTRFAEVAKSAAYSDAFVKQRSWTAEALLPDPREWACALSKRKNSVKRRGGTELVNYDEWKAEDTESYWEVRNVGRIFKRCGRREHPIAWGEQQAHPEGADQDDADAVLGGSPRTNPYAHSLASSDQWTEYTGLPAFQDLSPDYLKPDAPDPRLKLQVKLTRRRDQLASTEGRSAIRQAPDPTGARRNVTAYQSDLSDGEMAASAAVEVWFERPPGSTDNAWGARNGKPSELPSLFNPYWQVRLLDPLPPAATVGTAK
jgi:hypothetical protein